LNEIPKSAGKNNRKQEKPPGETTDTEKAGINAYGFLSS
jgi:hypothetical protein